MRFFGPLGPFVAKKALGFRFEHATNVRDAFDAFYRYVYHCNAGPASGEKALNKILGLGNWFTDCCCGDGDGEFT